MSVQWSQLSPIQRKRAFTLIVNNPEIKTELIAAFNNDPSHFSTGLTSNDAVDAIFATIQTMLNATTTTTTTDTLQTDNKSSVALISTSQSPLSLIAMIQFAIPYVINGFNVEFILGQIPEDQDSGAMKGLNVVLNTLTSLFFSQQPTDLRNTNSPIPTQYQIPAIPTPITTSVVHGSDSNDLIAILKETIAAKKTDLVSIHLVGPKTTFLTPLNNAMLTIAPQIIITSTQPAPSVVVIPDLCIATGEHKATPSTPPPPPPPLTIPPITQQIAANLVAQVDPRNPLYNQISRSNIVYVQAPVYKEVVQQLAVAVKAALSHLTSQPSLTPAQQKSNQTILQTAKEHYLFHDDGGDLDTDRAVTVVNNVITIVKTNHWASLDLTPLNNTPTVLCIPYRNNVELIGFLGTAVTTHHCAIYGENLSAVYEIAHCPKVVTNHVTINTLNPSTIAGAHSQQLVVLEPHFSPQLLTRGSAHNDLPIFTANKETGLLNPFIALDQRYRTQHQSLSAIFGREPVAAQFTPSITKSRPVSFPLLPTIPSTSPLPAFKESLSTIDSTVKQYISGKQCRSEGEYSLTIPLSTTPTPLILPAATRKDLRDAVEAAQAAHPGWAKTSGSLRLQIMLYLAENLAARYATLLPPHQLQLINQVIFHSSQYCDKYAGIAHPVVSAVQDGQKNNNLYTPSLEQQLESDSLKLTPWTELPLTLTVPNDLQVLSEFKYTLNRPQGVVVLRLPTNIDFVSFLSLLIPLLVRGNTVVVLFHITAANSNGTPNVDLMAVELITQFYQVLETTGLSAVSILFSAGCWDDESTTNALKHLDIEQFVTVLENGTDYCYAKQFLNNALKNSVAVAMDMVKDQFVFQDSTIAALNMATFTSNSHFLISAATTTREITIKRW